jgi:demethylmenaquinone methyltransferase/2-methoxy-6-polyprenyl-1,4-benzoquinol methylase
MDKDTVKRFFDRYARQWDARQVRHEDRIRRILDVAEIREGVSVLDVACGTGVLIPDYLARNVKSVTGVDLSPAMIACAQKKFADPRVTLLCADVEALDFSRPFDRCVVYNAFPHFPDPSGLIRRLAAQLAPGGRLTIAHGMSRAQIDRHHSGAASDVSIGLISEHALSALMDGLFEVDVALSGDEIYVVSGRKRECEAESAS